MSTFLKEYKGFNREVFAVGTPLRVTEQAGVSEDFALVFTGVVTNNQDVTKIVCSGVVNAEDGSTYTSKEHNLYASSVEQGTVEIQLLEAFTDQWAWNELMFDISVEAGYLLREADLQDMPYDIDSREVMKYCVMLAKEFSALEQQIDEHEDYLETIQKFATEKLTKYLADFRGV